LLLKICYYLLFFTLLLFDVSLLFSILLNFLSFVPVLVQLLDQYLIGGVVPTRADLDHVFLRFGKRNELQQQQQQQQQLQKHIKQQQFKQANSYSEYLLKDPQ
jgi:hypothetical protein